MSARPTTDQLIAAWTTEVVGSGAADYLPEVMAVVNRTSQNRFARAEIAPAHDHRIELHDPFGVGQTTEADRQHVRIALDRDDTRFDPIEQRASRCDPLRRRAHRRISIRTDPSFDYQRTRATATRMSWVPPRATTIPPRASTRRPIACCRSTGAC